MDYLEIVVHALSYIEEHLYENFGTERFYNSDIELSEFHVYHLFKSVVGIPVFEYVEKRRLSDQMYRWAASNRKWTLIEAAQFSQFSSHKSFIKALKKNFTISPRRYYKTFDGRELYKAFNIHKYKRHLNHQEIKQHVKVIRLENLYYQGELKKNKPDFDSQIYYNSVFTDELNYKCLYGNETTVSSDKNLYIPEQDYLRFKGLSDELSYEQLLKYIYGEYLVTHKTKLKNGSIDMIQKHNRHVKFNKQYEIEILIPIESG